MTVTDSPSLEFASPWSHRLFIVAKLVFVEILLGGIAAAGFWGGLVGSIWPRQSPAWIHVVGALAVLGVIIGVYLLFERGEPRRCVLSEHRAWLGGRFLGRSMDYDQVALLKLMRPEGSIGKSVQLVLEDHGGKKLMIWLRAAAAEECLEALRTLCEHAPAIDLDGDVMGPADDRFIVAAAKTIEKERIRTNRSTLGTAVACTIIGGGCIAALIFGGPKAWNHPKVWIGAVLGPIGAVGAFGTWIYQRRSAGSAPFELEDDAA
jgi:hypothetical protein